MEKKDIDFLEGLATKDQWNEFKKDCEVRLTNGFFGIRQLMTMLELCNRELAKFPEEENPAPEAEEAAKEIEELSKE